MRSLRFTNSRGVEITLKEDRYGITKLEGLGTPDLIIQEQKVPFQDGSVAIDQLLSSREITVEGVITVGNNNPLRYQYRRELCTIIDSKYGPGELIYTNDHGSWKTSCVPKGPVFANKNANEGNQRFQISFYCHDPYWYDVSESTISLQTIQSLIEFPITFPAGGLILSEYVGEPKPVYNSGDYSTPITIQIYGACENPKLEKTSTGEYIKINKILATGDLIEINTKSGFKTVYYTPFGGTRENAINALDFESTFIQLDAGYNELSFTDDTASGEKLCYVNWSNRYIGV